MFVLTFCLCVHIFMLLRVPQDTSWDNLRVCALLLLGQSGLTAKHLYLQSHLACLTSDFFGSLILLLFFFSNFILNEKLHLSKIEELNGPFLCESARI